MDSTENAPSAIDAIDSVAFKVGLKGYNVDEVDEFLERLSVEVRQLRDLSHQQRQQLRQAAERISQLDSRQGSSPAPLSAAPMGAPSESAEQVTSMIVLAQRFIQQAQQEAEGKAREFTSAAQERAREIVSEARSRAEDEVNRLNGLKQRLSEDVETLSSQLQAERARISQVLAEFTRWVETSLSQRAPSSGSHAHSAPPESATPQPSASSVTARPARPVQAPPPAPAPSAPLNMGQVLNFDSPSGEERL